MTVVVEALIVALGCLLGGTLLLRGMQHDRRVQRRLAGLRGAPVRDTRIPAGSAVPRMVAKFGIAVARSGLLPSQTLKQIEEALASAGLRRRSDLGLFVGSKLLLLFGAPPLTYFAVHEFAPSSALARLLPFAAAAAGLLLPDALLRRSRQRYLDSVTDGVPDALDMLVICAQAGLGLEPAMNRVAIEMRHSHWALSRELTQTTNELRISVDSRAALLNLGARTGLDSLKRVASTLSQTLQYGTPLTDALRALAAETRQTALTRFEERAARLPVMLTMPMILFIFPCVFIVIGGPAVLSLMKAFGH